MGRKVDEEKAQKLVEYVFSVMDEGGILDFKEAGTFTGYSPLYIQDLFSKRRIIRQQIVTRYFEEGSSMAAMWPENFEERMQSLEFWGKHLDKNGQKEIEECVHEQRGKERR